MTRLPVALVALVLAAAACQSSEAGQAAAGAECFVASDCAEGLACIPQRNGGRRCSNDLTEVAGDPPAEGEGGAEAAADAPMNDAPMNDAPADAPQDTGNDAGMDTGADTGDTGTG